MEVVRHSLYPRVVSVTSITIIARIISPKIGIIYI